MRYSIHNYRAMAVALASVLSLLLLAQISTAQDEKQATVDVAELMNEGRMALGNEEWSKAAEAFGKVTKADKDNGMAWHLLGYALHLDGKLDEAIKHHKKASTFDDVKGISLYNLGCAYSLKDDTKKSLMFLNQALDAGFDQLSNFEQDSDLANVRKAKGFKAIARRVKNGGKRPPFKTKSLVGKWNVTKGVRAGEKVDASRLPQIVIDEKTITIPAGEENFVMEYKINDQQRPLKIDMKITAGPAPEGSKAVGLLRKQQGKLMLVYDPTGGKRPEKFESTSDDGNYLFEMTLADAEGKAQADDDDDDDDDDDGI